MTTAQDVINVATAEIGYLEGGGTGHNGNITKYWAELDPALEGQSWCAVFVSWVFKHAGFPLPPMDRSYGYVNCASAVHYAQAHGLFDASGHYAPGDIILYGPGGGQHTGIVVSDDGVNIHTIEGNTMPNDYGSQWNGGGVYARVRPHGPYVFGVMKTSRLLAAPAPTQASSGVPPVFIKPTPAGPSPSQSLHEVVDLQGAVHVVADGDWGPATDAALKVVREFAFHRVASDPRALQRAVGAVADGIIGPNTKAAVNNAVRQIQKALGVAADGDWGPQTDAAFLAAEKRFLR
jgi:peptidoglycan hydrolase-like protein with peptidoglycan-binding domain